MRPVAACLIFLLLSGCATRTGTGVKWYAPATWFSHAPADRVDAAEARENEAKKKAVKAAQKLAHETQIALREAPDSRPVAAATESNDTVVALLDQAADPLDAATLAALRKNVSDLLSDNAALRQSAEKLRAETQRSVASLSLALSSAQKATEAAQGKMREAFERENALANELRTERWWSWFWRILLGALSVLFLAGWFYVRFTLGGMPGAVKQGLAAMRAKGLIPPEHESNDFDAFLNRIEQRLIRRS